MPQPLDIRLRNLRLAPRCGAKTRGGSPCRLPALRGRTRCKLHGGLSTGAPKGSRNGNFVDGAWTAEAIEERRWAKDLVRGLVGKGGGR
jgi:glucans biosynthesis protein